MSNWSEKDMDKLFQMGTEQYDFEYDPVAWQDMEHLLDRAERRRRILWWWLLGLGLMLTLSLLASYFFLRGNQFTEQVQSNKKTELASAKKAEKASPNSGRQLDESHHGQRTLPPAAEVETKEAMIGKQEDSPPGPTVLKEQRKLEKTPVAGPRPIKADGFSDKRNSLESSPSITAKNGGSSEWKSEVPIPEPKEAPDDPVEEIAPAAQISPEKKQRAALSPYGISTMPHLLIFVENEEAVPKTPSVPIDSSIIDVVKKRAHPGSSAFLIGLSTAAEWNSVGFGDFSQQNWKFGVHAEYRFRERFGVSLGATWMRMDYDAGMGEYTPEAGFWVDGIMPESTFGRCDMLELPIEFNYYMNGLRSDGFFASVGLSSYLILEEHYWYNYEEPRPDLVFYWGTQKDERDFLSLGLVSFGYQKRFSPKWSTSIGPYMQFPLTGVGHGAVKIYSLGLKAKVNFWVR